MAGANLLNCVGIAKVLFRYVSKSASLTEDLYSNWLLNVGRLAKHTKTKLSKFESKSCSAHAKPNAPCNLFFGAIVLQAQQLCQPK